VSNKLTIIQPDDWHVHFREGEMLKAIANIPSKFNKRCIAMPNTNIPITNSEQVLKYRGQIYENVLNDNFEVLIPCYLNENINLKDFKHALINNFFIGGKLYPIDVTNNSSFGISKIENIFPLLEILEEEKKILLIHGEKTADEVKIFDREKYFIDQDLKIITNKFKNLKIVLEHVSSAYGVDCVKSNKNMAGTITPHHMLLTKKDLFNNDLLDPFHFCMPVVKDEKDLVALRDAACKDNNNFFVGTDSAPHHINDKKPNFSTKPGIFSSFCSIELYAKIFEEEKSINSLEKFLSINGPNFYNLPLNKNLINLEKIEWTVPEFLEYNSIKVKNFYGNKKINWKVTGLKV